LKLAVTTAGGMVMSEQKPAQELTRRRILQTLTVGLATRGLLRSQPVEAAGVAKWGYGGADGPAHWGQLGGDNKVCGLGKRQSPIDLSPAHLDQGPKLALHWRPLAATVSHNGHTIQVDPTDTTNAGSFLDLGEQRYSFLQFHFHHPSEHALAGNRWPLEAHFVHKSVAGNDLTVIGVLFRPGRVNDVLEQVFSQMPSKPGTTKLTAAIDMSQLLPASAVTYRYAGSLTTPPCSEIVNWLVFRDPIEAGIGQIDSFARLFPLNARPLQPLAGRSVSVDLF
jgi:carbonic anhydrase